MQRSLIEVISTLLHTLQTSPGMQRVFLYGWQREEPPQQGLSRVFILTFVLVLPGVSMDTAQSLCSQTQIKEALQRTCNKNELSLQKAIEVRQFAEVKSMCREGQGSQPSQHAQTGDSGCLLPEHCVYALPTQGGFTPMQAEQQPHEQLMESLCSRFSGSLKLVSELKHSQPVSSLRQPQIRPAPLETPKPLRLRETERTAEEEEEEEEIDAQPEGENSSEREEPEGPVLGHGRWGEEESSDTDDVSSSSSSEDYGRKRKGNTQREPLALRLRVEEVENRWGPTGYREFPYLCSTGQ